MYTKLIEIQEIFSPCPNESNNIVFLRIYSLIYRTQAVGGIVYRVQNLTLLYHSREIVPYQDHIKEFALQVRE